MGPERISNQTTSYETIDALGAVQLISLISSLFSGAVVLTYAGARFRNWLRGAVANSLAGKQYVITTTLQDAIWEVPICKKVVIVSAVVLTLSLGAYGIATAVKASVISQVDRSASFCDAFDMDYSVTRSRHGDY